MLGKADSGAGAADQRQPCDTSTPEMLVRRMSERVCVKWKKMHCFPFSSSNNIRIFFFQLKAERNKKKVNKKGESDCYDRKKYK